MTVVRLFRRISPIYINTLNVFQPLKTWWANHSTHKFPTISISVMWKPFNYVKDSLYTWYWWEHISKWNLNKKLLIVLIDDVQYKYTYGIRQLESIPFIFIKIFNFNLIIQFDAPKYENNYEYYESMATK